MVCGLVMVALVMVELAVAEALVWTIEAFDALAALLLMSPK